MIKKRLGRSGLKQYAGYVHEEDLAALQGSKGVKIYKEMSNDDAVIGAILLFSNMSLRAVDWSVVPVEGGEDEAEFIESCIHDMDSSWEETVAEILTMIVYGWSFHEIVYKIRDGKASKFDDKKVGWAGWESRSQDSLERWEFDDQDHLIAMVQRPEPDYVERTVPLAKSLLFRIFTTKNNPEGKSLLRNAYRSWYRKKNLEVIEAIGIERDLAGLPVLHLPQEVMAGNKSGASSEALAAYNTYEDMVQNLRNDEEAGVILPSTRDENGNLQYELSLLSTGGSRQIDTDSIIKRYDARIAMTVLADFLLIGHQGTGTYSLAEEKSKTFNRSLNAILDIVCDIVNTQASPTILRLNAKDPALTPKLTHSPVQGIKLADLANFINALTGAEIDLKDAETVNHIRAAADLPKV